MRIFTAIGVTVMGAVLIGSIVRAGQKISSGGFTVTAAAAAGGAAVAIDADGVQRVALSFGAFNYSPDTIRVRRGVPVEITADTQKLRGCFSSFVLPELSVWKQFTPTNRTLAFTPTRPGTFRFSCAMGMGAGKLIVES